MPENYQRLWHLISRKLSGEACQEELKDLEQLTSDNYLAGYYFQMISDYWQCPPYQNAEDLENAFSRHLERMHKKEIEL